MTTSVVSVSPSTTIRQTAAILLANGISAVPVIDASGTLVGMVSEGDLVDGAERSRAIRRDWWLEMLAEGTTLSQVFANYVRSPDRPIRDVMVAPVTSVAEDAPVEDIAALLDTQRIKRVPVMRNGRVVGIVSRADLLRTLARERS